MGLIDAGSLDLLTRKAHAFESQAEADLPPLPGEPPPVDPVQEWADLIGLIVMLGTPLLPYLPAIYTDETVKELAGAVQPVAAKYGIDGTGLGSTPELRLLIVAAPLAVGTYVTHRAWREQQKGPSPAVETVTNVAPPPPVPGQAPRDERHLGEFREDRGGRLN
ncbi:hypothetical protein [Ralstonia sp.]|uniref:hypothetical protein n=1 Tax=Ralstonia sp. TaxID=54061 RepID=UPI0031DF007B